MSFLKTNHVNITANGQTYNSLDDFGLAISNTDYIGTPVQQVNETTVPGLDGVLDFTDSVFGGPSYDYRTIKIEFGGLELPELWDQTISTFRNLFEGHDVKLVFATDPEWYYSGRCRIDAFQHTRSLGTFSFVIEHAYPYKQKDITLTTTATSAGKTLTANVTRQTVVPEVTCSSTITINDGNQTYEFRSGTSKNLGFRLAPGTHTLTVKGSGAVTITYKDGSL